jgi:hypothetical protein
MGSVHMPALSSVCSHRRPETPKKKGHPCYHMKSIEPCLPEKSEIFGGISLQRLCFRPCQAAPAVIMYVALELREVQRPVRLVSYLKTARSFLARLLDALGTCVQWSLTTRRLGHGLASLLVWKRSQHDLEVLHRCVCIQTYRLLASA